MILDLQAWIRECGFKLSFEWVAKKKNVFADRMCHKARADKKDVIDWERNLA